MDAGKLIVERRVILEKLLLSVDRGTEYLIRGRSTVNVSSTIDRSE